MPRITNYYNGTGIDELLYVHTQDILYILFAMIQVSLALAYLHTKKAIVHYDIKPDNILVFRFPQAGHSCFGMDGSLTCMLCQTDKSGVLVKLTDLGVSAFVGPVGFHRKPATVGHAAPETIEHLGQYPVGEKVSSLLYVSKFYAIIHTYTHACIHVNTHTHKHTHACAYTHTQTHTRTNKTLTQTDMHTALFKLMSSVVYAFVG